MEFKGSKIKDLLRSCSEIEQGNYLGGYFSPSLVQVENELDEILDENRKMLEMLEKLKNIMDEKCIYSVSNAIRELIN